MSVSQGRKDMDYQVSQEELGEADFQPIVYEIEILEASCGRILLYHLDSAPEMINEASFDYKPRNVRMDHLVVHKVF